MRPSYDAEHPSAPTPIYDELYSEYRRLFRALPGDRSGEEDMRFTGFAVRERSYPGRLGLTVAAAAPPHPAALEGYRALEEPRQEYGGEPYPGQVPPHQPFAGYPAPQQFVPAQQVPAQQQVHHPQQPVHQAQHTQQPQAQQQHQPPSVGQGWVATGYLAPVTLPSPAQPPTVPAPATPGRHRGGLLSLPPGQS
ncbi:hypothetical protein ACFW1A_37660 [Kitasatospora sp. NPDC058965]|uniref:hypothetical protein n=1 Tax=Kitasatospora sp. NPDC058965 TaxID=3346682 RepID=UPI00368078BC